MLKRGILNLDLAPRAILDEVLIANQLGVSKTPVREALARLEGEGLIVTGPGRKSRVADISIQFINDVFEVRQLLESALLRELTPRMTDEDLDCLRQMLERAAESLNQENLVDFVEANDEFHSYLVRRMGNQYLIDMVGRLLEQKRRVTAAIFRSEQLIADYEISRKGMESHFGILEALFERDGDRAAELMKNDIQIFIDALDTVELQEHLSRLAFSDE